MVGPPRGLFATIMNSIHTPVLPLSVLPHAAAEAA